MSLWAFLDAHYHQAPHAGLLGRAPAPVYEPAVAGRDALKEARLRGALTVRVRRRVRRDATVPLDGVDYEIDRGFLAGRLLTVARCLVDLAELPWVERLSASVVREAELFVAVDLEGGGRHPEATVRLASAVRREWLAALFPGAVTADETLVFDSAREAVVARRRERYLDLTFAEAVRGEVDPGQAGALLADAVLRDPALRARVTAPCAALLDRLAFLARAMPELALPADTDALVAAAVHAATAGRRACPSSRRSISPPCSWAPSSTASTRLSPAKRRPRSGSPPGAPSPSSTDPTRRQRSPPASRSCSDSRRRRDWRGDACRWSSSSWRRATAPSR